MTKLIIGLGNPNSAYEKTRHNTGFMLIDLIQKKLADFSNWKEDKKNQSIISTANVNGNKIILAKPQTFMNKSGQAVQKLVSYYNVDLGDLLVIHDDIDILLGEYKLQREKSSAGHKGVEDIIEKLKSNDFWRLRIGIARPERKKMGDAAKFVLQKFTLLERKKLKRAFSEILEKETLI